MSASYLEKHLASRNSFWIRAYLIFKRRLNGFLIFFGMQLVTKTKVMKCTSAKEIVHRFEKLRPRNYGGEVQRIGADSDGGYLVPNLNYSGVVSPGVGDQVAFENYFVSIDKRVVCIDGSVSRPNNLSTEAIFVQKYLSGSINDDTRITLKEVLENFFPSNRHLLLQCDIEGSEWDALLSCDTLTLKSFAAIVLEIHYLDRLRTKDFVESQFDVLFSKLLEQFVIINTHPNNAGEDFFIGLKRFPEILELTLVNKLYYVGSQIFDLSLQTRNKPNVTYRKERSYQFLK